MKRRQPAIARNLWHHGSMSAGMIALIPIKTLARVKSRLADTLDSAARIRLMRDTLRRTIEALQQSRCVEAVCVVTPDPQVAGWAETWGAQALPEMREDLGLNDSLEEARHQLMERYPNAGALLVVPGDLAWLHPEDVLGMTALLPGGDRADQPAVVIAPDRRGKGTNALLLRPPRVIPFCFGPGSARAHAQQALQNGAALRWYDSSSTSLDVDEPDDLKLYHVAPYLW